MGTKDNFSIKKQILLIFVIAAVVLITVLSIYVYSTVKTSEEQFAQTAQTAMQLFASDVQMQLSASETYLVDLALHSEAFRRLGSETSPLQSYQDGYEIWMSMPPIINSNDLLTGIVLYSPANDQLFGRYSNLAGSNLEQRARTRDELQSAITRFLSTGPVNTQQWTVQKLSGRTYWIRAIRYGGVSIMAFIDLELLQLQAAEALAAGGNICILNGEDPAPEAGENPHRQTVTWLDSGYGRCRTKTDRFLVFRESIGNLQLQHMIPYSGSLVSGSTLETVLMVCVLLSILAMASLWLYIRWALFRPLDALVSTMERIGQGDLTARPGTNLKNQEFKQVNDTFNTMIQQITALKIDSYEKQLSIQKSEMISLKLQIRPHFFLNCLKKLYAFAQIGQIADIQKMILLLSSHLRYVFSYQTETVQLQQELELCRNYLELCSLGQRDSIIWHSEIPQTLRSLPVPTVSILTFVENCAQYAVRGNTVLTVTVTASRLDLGSSTMANLSIADNGPGFTEEQLESLNRLDGTQIPQQHVGILNVLRRFRLLYGEEFTAAFTNKRDGGARIDLFIPLTEPERSNPQDETADC